MNPLSTARSTLCYERAAAPATPVQLGEQISGLGDPHVDGGADGRVALAGGGGDLGG
jgi:hypothetical protein